MPPPGHPGGPAPAGGTVRPDARETETEEGAKAAETRARRVAAVLKELGS
ncbi:hypothetical protein LLS1_00280 [Leifsonia sp. LS1]|nr:hypothetical protein LLS1_00280 [Leifsonia sp. LS1]